MSYKEKLKLIFSKGNSDDFWYLLKDLLNVSTEEQCKKVFTDGQINYQVCLDEINNKEDFK
mgnify:CR=1 FL=1